MDCEPIWVFYCDLVEALSCCMPQKQGWHICKYVPAALRRSRKKCQKPGASLVIATLIESQNDLGCRYLSRWSNNSAMGRETSYKTRLLKAPSPGVRHPQTLLATCSNISPLSQWKISPQCLIWFYTLLNPLLLVTSGLSKKMKLLFVLQVLFRYCKTGVRYPWNLLFSKLNKPNSLSFSS